MFRRSRFAGMIALVAVGCPLAALSEVIVRSPRAPDGPASRAVEQAMRSFEREANLFAERAWQVVRRYGVPVDQDRLVKAAAELDAEEYATREAATA